MGIGENMQYKRFPLWEKGCLAAIIILILAALLPARSLEAKEDRPVVRVGYPIQQGLTEIDENGNYTGYIYDYLQEIAQYTGWDYEFVRAEGDINESLMTLMEMLETERSISWEVCCITAGWRRCMITPPTAAVLYTRY